MSERRIPAGGGSASGGYSIANPEGGLGGESDEVNPPNSMKGYYTCEKEIQRRLLRDLCLEIARNQIGGKKFNELLLESGIHLNEQEWEVANKILGRSTQLMNWVEQPLPSC